MFSPVLAKKERVRRDTERSTSGHAERDLTGDRGRACRDLSGRNPSGPYNASLILREVQRHQWMPVRSLKSPMQRMSVAPVGRGVSSPESHTESTPVAVSKQVRGGGTPHGFCIGNSHFKCRLALSGGNKAFYTVEVHCEQQMTGRAPQ